MTTSVTRPCFSTQHQTCKTKSKTKTDFCWIETGIVLRPTVSDHISGQYARTLITKCLNLTSLTPLFKGSDEPKRVGVLLAHGSDRMPFQSLIWITTGVEPGFPGCKSVALTTSTPSHINNYNLLFVGGYGDSDQLPMLGWLFSHFHTYAGAV